MDIFYKNEMLYVNIDNDLTVKSATALQKQIFSIMEDYDIENVTVKLSNSTAENRRLIEPFITEYENKHSGSLNIV